MYIVRLCRIIILVSVLSVFCIWVSSSSWSPFPPLLVITIFSSLQFCLICPHLFFHSSELVHYLILNPPPPFPIFLFSVSILFVLTFSFIPASSSSTSFFFSSALSLVSSSFSDASFARYAASNLHGVAAISRLLHITGLFCRISFLW